MTLRIAARLLILGLVVTSLPVARAVASVTIQESTTALPDAPAFSLVSLPGADLGTTGFSLGAISFAFRNTGADEGVVNGSRPWFYAAPITDALGTPYAGNYLSTGSGTITLRFAAAQTEIGLLWGSVDAGNTLRLTKAGTAIGQITGAEISQTANGNRGIGGSEYVALSSTTAFDQVTLSSPDNSFEALLYAANTPIASHVPNAVPEPASTASFGVAMLGLAAMRRRRATPRAR